MHSDQIIDFPELAGTLWWRKPECKTLHGPTGTQDVVDGCYTMLKTDTQLRINGNQPVEHSESWKVDVVEHGDGGFVVEDGDVKIEAFDVPHGDIKPASGYSITTPDKVVVISGVTNYSEKLAEMATGAKILVQVNDGLFGGPQRPYSLVRRNKTQRATVWSVFPHTYGEDDARKDCSGRPAAARDRRADRVG